MAVSHSALVSICAHLHSLGGSALRKQSQSILKPLFAVLTNNPYVTAQSNVYKYTVN